MAPHPISLEKAVQQDQRLAITLAQHDGSLPRTDARLAWKAQLSAGEMPASMSKNIEVLERLYDAFERRDLDAFRANAHPDVAGGASRAGTNLS